MLFPWNALLPGDHTSPSFNAQLKHLFLRDARPHKRLAPPSLRHPTHEHIQYPGIHRFIALYTYCFFVFLIEGLRQPYIKQAYRHHFSNKFAHFMSVSHFGNSHNISKFFIIIIFFMVIFNVSVANRLGL